MANQFASSWTHERTEKFKEMFFRNLSSQLIAEELGGISRSAILGKANRMGLVREGEIIGVTPQRRPPPPPKPSPAPLNLSMMELHPFHCRYITNEDMKAATYCGHWTFNESSWCKHHFDMVTEPRRERRA